MRFSVVSVLSIGALIGITVSETDARGRCRTRFRCAPVYCRTPQVCPEAVFTCPGDCNVIRWTLVVVDGDKWKWRRAMAGETVFARTCEKKGTSDNQHSLYNVYSPRPGVGCPGTSTAVYWFCDGDWRAGCTWQQVAEGEPYHVATCETADDPADYSLYKKPCPCQRFICPCPPR